MRPAILGVLLTVAAAGAGMVYAADEGAPVEAIPDCAATPTGPFPPLCRHEAPATRIVTVDVTVAADQDEVAVEVPLGGIRTAGAIVQLYYNSAVGKAEWFMVPDLAGVVLFPDNVTLPMGKWVASGLRPGAIVRVVVLTGQP